MYCIEPANKRQKIDDDDESHIEKQHDIALNETEISKDNPNTSSTNKSPVLENKQRSFQKCIKNNLPILKRLSKFSRTILDDNLVESKFFASNEDVKNDICDTDTSKTSIVVEESPEKICRNPFKVKKVVDVMFNSDHETESLKQPLEIDTQCSEIPDTQLESSQKENSSQNSPKKGQTSPILESSPKIRNMFKLRMENICNAGQSEESVIENTYPMEKLMTPVDSQVSTCIIIVAVNEFVHGGTATYFLPSNTNVMRFFVFMFGFRRLRVHCRLMGLVYFMTHLAPIGPLNINYSRIVMSEKLFIIVDQR